MFWTVAIISVAAVGVFALALSLTLIFKGHNIRSEVGTNPDMQRLGLECPAREGREKDCGRDGKTRDRSVCGDCSVCEK
jgi:hypothetical protein